MTDLELVGGSSWEQPIDHEILNPIERQSMRIFNGDTTELLHAMAALELIVELRRSEAVHNVTSLLKHKMVRDGYLTISDIDDGVAAFHYSEVLEPDEAA